MVTSVDTSNDVGYKIMSIVCIFAVAFCTGCIPLLWARCRKDVSMLGVANAFAAGIFLTMGLAHLLPEASSEIAQVYGEKDNEKFRVAYMVCIAGYTVILTIQRVLIASPDIPSGREEAAPLLVTSTNSLVESVHNPESQAHSEGVLPEPRNSRVGDDDYSASNPRRLTSQFVRQSEKLYDQRENAPTPDSHVLAATLRRFSTYVLMTALALHGLFAGIALGLQRGKRDILLLFLAIMAHKWAESLSLGVSMSKSMLPRKLQLILISVFSCSSPIGIGIGWMAEKALPQVATGYFMALSAGTFLYIGASEVVVEEFVQGMRYFRKLFGFVAGCLVIFFATAFTDVD